MKSLYNFICKVVLAFVLCVLVFLLFGCSSNQLGETKEEVQRRHKRVLRTNHQEMMRDIDKVLLLDEPSKLTDRRTP
jgi:outer membrane biogenesis lipoprotein LolB